MIPIHHLDGRKIAVFGMGRSGLACALSAQAGGVDVVVYDGNDASVAKAEAEGLTYADLTRPASWDGIELLVVSPGIPHLYPSPNPIVQMALDRGVAIDNDVSLFFREMNEGFYEFEDPPRTIAITGSNGKSTTTALLHHILSELGHRVQMGGNIGRGVFDLDPPREGEIYVLELSSYQTELAQTLTPNVAIFTNLSPDHLDRHNGMGGYFAAKSRLFTQSFPRSIIGVSEVEGQFLENQMRAQGARVNAVSMSGKLTGRPHYYQVKKGFLTEWNKDRQAASIDLRPMVHLAGAHNWQNAACAFGAVRALNIAPRRIETAMASFAGLAHRTQLVGEANGVKFVNDSKATNADATRNALMAFKNIHWIVGGRAKDGGINDLADLLPNVKRAYVIGEAAEAFSQTLGNHPHEITETIKGAVDALAQNLADGDVVLLSPAAASFDQYADFEERGNDFTGLVKSKFGV